MTNFKPDWVSAPGDTIQECLDIRHQSLGDFSIAMHMSSDDVDSLLNGSLRIDSDIAARLVDVIGCSVQFWLTREAQYRTSLKRIKQKQKEKT